MNGSQRFVFLLGVVIIGFMGSCPPWKEAGPKGLPKDYAPIYAPPKVSNPANGLEIDFARLLLQVGVVAVLTGGLITATSTQAPQIEEKKKIAASTKSKPERIEKDDESASEDESDEEIVEDSASEEEVSDSEAVVFKFPKGKIYGEFLVEAEDDPESWEWYADVAGTVKLPVGRPVQLEVVEKENVDLSFIALLKADTLHSIDLTNCQLNDWELSNLSKLKGLKELDLTGTNISSEAITYVGDLNKLEKLWLDGTKIDDQSVTSLKKLSTLKKLSLRKTKISQEGVERLKSGLSTCKIEC